jgi:hypothetical protein
MFEAAFEVIELEEEACQTVETEQERLDRDGIYGEIKRELIKRGIPAHEIAFIHDFKTPAEKAMAFADGGLEHCHYRTMTWQPLTFNEAQKPSPPRRS